MTTVVDVTDRERTRARETALAAVRDTVGGSLDTAVTCRALIDALVPGFADLAAVEVVDDVLRGVDPPVGPLPPDTPLCRAASGRCDTPGDKPQPQPGPGPDPAPDPDPREDRPRPAAVTRRLPLRTPFALTAADLRPRLVPLTPETPWLGADAHAAHAVAESGAHSLIVAPLSLRGAVLGLVSLYRCGAAEPFDEDDVTLAVAAATRAALAIDNARRFEREHVIASTVQRRLLPQAAREQAAVETAHVLLPGRDSGCWYDTIALVRRANGPRGRPGRGGGPANGHRHGPVAYGHPGAGRSRPGAGRGAGPAQGHRRPSRRGARQPAPGRRPPARTAQRGLPVRGVRPVRPHLHRRPRRAPRADRRGAGRAGGALRRTGGPGALLRRQRPLRPRRRHPGRGQPARVLHRRPAHRRPCRRTHRRDPLPAGPHPAPGPHDDVVYALPADTRRRRPCCWPVRERSPTTRSPPGTCRRSAGPRPPPGPSCATGSRSGAWTRTPSRRRSSSSANWSPTPSATAPRRCGCASCSTPRSPARSTTVPPPPPHLRHARTVDEGGRGLFIVSRLASHWGARHGPDGKVLWTEQDLPGGASERTAAQQPE